MLLGFFQKYHKELLTEKRFGELRTPVQGVIKNNKLQSWIYDLGTTLTLNHGETGKYYKGLGSWKEKDLKYVVEQDGIQNMINLFVIDDNDMLDNWLSSSKADKRKEMISNNKFDITGI